MESKQLQFISQLSSYQLKSVLFRLGSVSAVAILFITIARMLVLDSSISIPFIQYVKIAIIFNIISESNVLLDNIAERYLPIPSMVVLRGFLHLVLSLFIGALAIIYFQHQIKDVDLINQPITWLMFAFGFIFVFILIVVAISLRITAKWISSKKEVEELKEAQLRNDYNALQDQLNPHFLFNNLSVLKSMIKYDTDAAIQFTQNFTDTYRYVLQCKDKTTVQLKEEIDFIKAYIALHEERLGIGLNVHFQLDESYMNKEIPPLSLQLLIENAIKHNVVGKDEPLFIKVFTSSNSISVENNLQLKESTYSTYKGLKNLIARYTLLTEKEVHVFQNEKIFRVDLPLL
ncbi:MAG: sensor histidine kinase [Prolixibacteraceae bacterium]